MFKFIAWLFHAIHVFVGGITRLSEWFEGFFRFAFELFLHPGQWFRRESQTDEVGKEDELKLDAFSHSLESYSEEFLAVTIWLLLTPWRWLRRNRRENLEIADGRDEFAGATESFESYFTRLLSVIARLLMPWLWFRKTPDSIEVELEAGERKGVASGLLSCLRKSGFFIVGAFAEVCEFLGEWWYSRNFIKLVWATPGALMAIPLMASLILTPLYSSDNKIKHYQLALVSATEESNSAKENLCLEKLDQLGYQRLDRAEYLTAVALVKEEKFEAAYEIMKNIAPKTQAGFLPAHLWIAAAVIEGHIKVDEPWETIEIHTRYLASLKKSPFVKRLQVEIHLHHSRIEQAVELMASIVDLFPHYHVALMHSYYQRGDVIRARKHAKRAIEFFAKEETRSDGLDNTITALGYLQWAQSHNVLGEQESEYRVLTQAAVRYPSDALITRATDHVIDERLSKITFESSDAPAIIEAIIKANPNHQDTWEMLLKGVWDENQRAHKIVDDLRSKELLPARFVKQLGDVYFNKNDYATANHFYELACEQDPNSAFAWNNIAWILGNIEPVKIREALDAANTAIAYFPDPQFFETRGQILMKLEKWTEAIADFQRAINGQIPNSADAHRSLAAAYDQLGHVEQAAAHRSTIKTPGL